MKRAIRYSPKFIRSAKHLADKNPSVGDAIEKTVAQLSEDAFHPALKTHKLRGALEGSWSSSAGWDLRIIFSFIKHEGKDAILLQTVGSHDDVY